MEICGCNRWKEREDDMVDILREAGCLKLVSSCIFFKVGRCLRKVGTPSKWVTDTQMFS